jgi:predicted PurR-regulated permease PerM
LSSKELYSYIIASRAFKNVYNSGMKVKIEIDTRTLVRFWLVVIGLAVVSFVIYSAWTALVILTTAFFLSLVLNPPVSRIARQFPSNSRVLGTALSYVAVIIILGAFIFLVVPPIVQQTAKVAETIPSLVNGATSQYQGLNDFIDHYQLRPQVDSALNSIEDSASSVAKSVGTNLLSGIGSFFSTLTALILILVLAFLMLVEGPVWMNRIWSVYNDQERMEHHRGIVQRMYGVVTGYVTGQLTVSAIDGAISALAVFVLSLMFSVPANFAIATAAIMFVFSLIPMFGATIGALIVALVLAFNDWTAALIFIVFVILYQQVEANYVSPKIQSRRIELSPLAILASVTIGLYLFGIAGGIISIPIAGCIKILVEEYLKRARIQRQKNKKHISKFIKKIQDEDFV